MANEMRLIEMNTLWTCETCFHHGPNGCKTFCDAGESYRPAASKLKVIDPESLRAKGRWVHCGGDIHSSGMLYYCTQCYGIHFVNRRNALPTLLAYNELFSKPNYCPNCGADMGEG
jgi:hypothetical protein